MKIFAIAFLILTFLMVGSLSAIYAITLSDQTKVTGQFAPNTQGVTGDEIEHIVGITKAQRLYIKNLIPALTLSQETIQATVPVLQRPDTRETLQETFTVQAPQKTAVAQASTGDPTPIIDYYKGIESHPIEHLLYYLSRHQNKDGSFGTFNQYEITGEIALRLSNFNSRENGQYALMLDYLKSAAPRNNREKAIKARLMVGLGEPYQKLLDELIAEQHYDGGFGLEIGYTSDILTTLEVALALWVAAKVSAEKKR